MGYFKTTKVGNMYGNIFPRKSRDETPCVKPGIVVRKNSNKYPIFDMILGIDTLVIF